MNTQLTTYTFADGKGNEFPIKAESKSEARKQLAHQVLNPEDYELLEDVDH